LPAPAGSGPSFRRPVVVVQGDHLNRSRIATVVCVPLTSNLSWARAPGNALLSAKAAGLAKDSVANASQIIAVDRAFLTERVAKLSAKNLAQVMSEIDIVLGR
jgi:mRNA interferase MazF